MDTQSDNPARHLLDTTQELEANGLSRVRRVYTIKDSGKRQEFEGGMVRDTTDGKTNYALVADGPMLKRWAEHLTKGAEKYEKRNWLRAAGPAERDRARESAFRHFMQWFHGDADEDHAAAVFFNINQVAYIEELTRALSQER